MDEYGRRSGTLQPVAEDLFHFAPVPLIYRNLDPDEAAEFNAELMEAASSTFSAKVLDVPDRRHIDDLGRAPEMADVIWSEVQPTAVGIWHRVPTNNLLGLPDDAVKRLRAIIEDRYMFALTASDCLELGEDIVPTITESWIQVYKNGDDKVLHNHERYGPPYPRHPWSGAYYIADGSPDPDMPYSGVLSFRVRGENHFFRPRPGLLMMWPSDILHEVPPFYGGTERIVINFNINGGMEVDD